MESKINLRDYTIPAIEERIKELLKRRVNRTDGIPVERAKEKLLLLLLLSLHFTLYQAKYKEYRKERQDSLGTVHRHVLEVVAFILDTDVASLEEGLLDKEEYLDVFRSFFTQGGRRAVIIHYQPMSPPPVDENVRDETYYAYMEVEGKYSGALSSISGLISRQNSPALEINKQWGDLPRSQVGAKIRDNFIGDFKDFCQFIQTTNADLDNILKFDGHQDVFVKYAKTMENVERNAKDYDAIITVEECVRGWMKIMEKALVESQQLRRETEDVGPTAELVYWRGILTRFSYIVDHIKRAETQMFIALLVQAKSKLVKKWKKLDDDITMIELLARDNVKYLYAIEKYTRPLYMLEPTKIGQHLPALMQSIRMVYTTSRFFNTQRMITALFVKITNQLIITCKSYITKNGTLDIWQEEKTSIILRMKDCITLYEQYYESYKLMLQNIEAAGERQIEVSEMFVFGKFETFKVRLNKIIYVLEISINYSVLESSTIKGIDVFRENFITCLNKMVAQKYNPLDHRKPFFDSDYEQFKISVSETEFKMRVFFFKTVSLAPNIDEALRLVLRFEKLKFDKQLWIDRKYLELVTVYQQEVEAIRDRYNEDRSSPPLPRNIPPVAARILWIRQLYRRIEMPMDIFKKRQRVITHERMQKCIKIYNSLVRVFVHYEIIYHKAWFDSAEVVRLALTSPLLTRDPQANKYSINFDPYIREVIRESEYMSRLNFKIPEFTRIITFCREKIFFSYEQIKRLVEIHERIHASAPKLFLNLLAGVFVKLEQTFKPCLSVVTWTSLEIPEVCQEISSVVQDIEVFVSKVCATKEVRIEGIIENIADTELISLKDSPLSPAEFSQENFQFAMNAAREIEVKSTAVEAALIMIINKCLDFVEIEGGEDINEDKYRWLDPDRVKREIGSQSRITRISIDINRKSVGDDTKAVDPKSFLNRIWNDCMELFTYYNNKLIEALVKSTKNSLELLKRRIGSSSMLSDGFKNEGNPLLLTQFILQIPTILEIPSVEELNNHVQLVVKNLIQVHDCIIMWGQRYSRVKRSKDSDDKEKSSRTYHQIISDHKEIIRSTIRFQAIILILRDDINHLKNRYTEKYCYVWSEDRTADLQKFVDSDPDTQTIREKFIMFENLINEINNIPARHLVGPVEINMEQLKLGLLVEVKNWKLSYGSILSGNYKTKLTNIINYIEDKKKVLSRAINDLEDVRLAMKCLDAIRNDFIDLDRQLIAIEETYTLMAAFEIAVFGEDQNAVDGLRYSFTNMLQKAKEVQGKICEIQEPLKKELIEGVEVLKKDVENFDAEFERNGPLEEGIPAKEASERLLLFQSRNDELQERYQTYSSGEALFGLEVTNYPALEKRKKEMNLLQKLYGLYSQVMRTIDGYYEILWSEIDTDAIIAELTDLQNKCRKLPKGMRDWPAYIDLKKKIDDFNETCPLLELMANKSVKDRHWDRLSKLCNYLFDIESDNFTLANVMQAPLLKYKDDVEDICISALKEMDIESKLNQVIADWSVIDLQFATFKQRGELLLKGTETTEIISQLEDSLMVISSLMANRYNMFYKKDIQLWQSKLSNTSEILGKWLTVQNLWAYLEAVFIGGDIAKQLPGEAKRFNNIDKAWVKLMYRAREKMNAVETCTGDETMSQLLPHLLEQLESCQKSLSGYLETKRVVFPRFCFVSDPTLLEILGQAADSHTIQNYLDGFFDNVAKLEFSASEYDKVLAIFSREEEKVLLDPQVLCTGGVENWLNVLLKVHQQSVGDVISQGLQLLANPETVILTLIEESILQVALLALQTLWTRDSETAITSSRRDKMIMKKTNQWFLDLLNGLIEVTVKDLTQYQRAKYEALITIHVHQRDIFDELCRLKIRSIQDFEWLKQARFYYNNQTENVDIKITDVDFIYQNEFLGCTDRLVITPLTDRCYITLAQAVGMNFGGAPAGPAGTGKTETTKDMGKALGKYVIVFNCSDQMDFRGLGRIFKGLAQAGAWGCFDEFNRIDLPVLSVAAQQIAIVFTARKEKRKNFLFSDGETYNIDYEFGIFITMNPGYAGRQELPENLKTQFRSVAMMIPDRQIIIRVKLAACGFKDNIVLSRKFFTLYALCEEQLSKQVHYDFGLRNILSCLRTLGAQKRAHPGESEETTLMRVLRAMNLSKLVDEDEPLFLSLIEDMFPGIKLTTQSYKDLQASISLAVDSLGIINTPPWNLKVIQLYETSLVRHGLMILGPTGSGKTSCIWTLMKALTSLGTPHREIRMNPKAITAPQMFGRLDVATNDWTDGIFSTLWRRIMSSKKPEHVWLVLDGPVDAVWIENLNSVLDDNKTLTLANGDRIIMNANSKLVFEPDNIDNASPATVSRMGMVFISASVLKWAPILEGWLKTRPSHQAEILRGLFHKIYDDAHAFVQTKLQAKITLLEALYIRQSIDLLTGLLLFNDTKNYEDSHIERLFLFSLLWSLGAVLELDGRKLLEEYLLSHPSKCDWPKLLPEETLFEYLVSDRGEWIHWSQMVPDFVYPPERVLQYYTILVPNVDNTRTLFLIDVIARQGKPVLLIGEQGTGKTVMIKGYMSKYDPENHLNKSFNFSSASTPNMVQRVFESYVEKRVGTTYGPAGGKKMTVFIDDINMPAINEWGDQITNEIVRQLMEYRGFYSLDKPGHFSTIQDIQLLAAMIHPGGGRNDIPPRLKRQFNIFNCTLPSDRSLDTIFRAIGCGYFSEERFSKEVADFLGKLVPLTRIVWQQTKAKMLPTPAKFHYVFNLRDLSRIWEGILRIERAECKTPGTLLKLWGHECTRVISDRFVNADDKDWFKKTLQETGEKLLGDDFMSYEADAYFVNFLREAPDPTGDEPEDFIFEAPKTYEQIPSYEAVTSKVHENMTQFNESIRGMNLDLVFFDDALVHLMRISRILGVSRGNAMLVGVGGSGKQSLTRLASFIAGYSFFQIVLTRIYNVASLLDDIKKLYREAGTGSKGVTFIFTDNEIKDESFLEYINNVLSVGEIANLFPKDELDEITTSVIPLMKKEDPKCPPTPDNLYNFFITRARNNIHIVLCFSPVGEKFRSRALKFPALISGCTINWFSRWPRDALCAVSRHFLKSYDIVCASDVKEQLINTMAEIQDGINDTSNDYYDRYRRRIYVTPKSFLSFISGYKKIYKQRLDEINNLAFRMSNGLSKLVDAAAQVDELRKVLVENQAEIKIKNVQVEKILVTVEDKKKEAELIKETVQKSKDEAEALLKIISQEKAISEDKLKAAEPALLAAESALQTIKAADISTVRKLGKPPYLISLIMDCVLILFGRKLEPVKPDPEHKFLTPSWSEALKVMADTRFLYHLRDFQKDNINGEIIDLMRPYLNYPLYNYEAAKQACGNVAGLLQWTIAMTEFYKVNKDVLPLKANLAIQQSKHERANNNLVAAQQVLAAKDEALRVVQLEFDAVMTEYQQVVDLANACQSKMDTASALIEGLSGERVRWTNQLSTFKSETERLIGDVLILTGFLSYCGPFNQEFRVLTQKRWFNLLRTKKIPVSADVNIVDSLSDTAMTGEWNLQGLPNDELSIQNGIIVTQATRYPLLIDPQLQGKAWIKNKEQEFQLQTTLLTHKYFRNYLEDCVSIGRPLLIEDVAEELDPVLDNLLEKNFIKIGNSWKVKLGDKEVDINHQFRLYITTKLPNPSYTPEIFAKTSIIDFTVTMKGLEDQLLGRVIMTEKRELETERMQLITDVTTNKRKIKELEANLLHKLTTVQGSLIEDVELMSVLNTTRKTASDVTRKLNIARSTEIEINAAREEFRPVATRGSVLYFLICDMAHVNCMYQTSLVQFLERFDISLTRSEKTPINARRINFIIEYLTYEVFRYKARGLYENHKYMFVLLMTLKIDLERGAITYEEFQYLIKGGAALDLNTVKPKPFKWITDMTWLNLIALSSLHSFQYVVKSVEANEKTWKYWHDRETPEEEIIPDGFNSLDTFRRMLLIRAWCIDRTLSQSRKYISHSLGAKYAEPVITLLDVMHGESRANTPMICFLSMGSDPTPSINQLAKKIEVSCRSISMGQGQEVHARRLLLTAKTEGYWALLQNCHLGLDYMNELIDFILEMESPHDNFRIWITTEPHNDFPISLLQMSIKFTYEPPQGIRAGLLATYSGMNQDMLDQCDAAQYIPLVYTISFLHTIVQERRKYGPLGWNIPYEFNSADWLASCIFVNNHLNDYDPKRGISWQTIRYMIGEVQYGGRVTDDYDKRLLNTFTKVWFTESLFTENFLFHTGYGVLNFKQVTDYMSAIEEMEPIDPPQVYGLHRNADITYQSRTTQEILDIIISVQPKESGGTGTGETREMIVSRQAKDMLNKLPPAYDPFDVKARLQIMGITQPMNIFLKQEIDRMQVVIRLVRSMLKDLLLAIDGVIIMNEQLKDALDNIYDARIPKVWRLRSWESSTLGFWFTELLERNQQFSSWIFQSRPAKFWMTGFFNPQGFLTAMRQEVTRAHKGWALDNVTLHNEVMKQMSEDVKSSPAEGIYVYGLYLEGAAWDRRNNRLRESFNKVLYVEMPVVHIFALYNKPIKDPKLYQCPVYKKPKRTYTQLVTALWLQTIKPPEFWILRGVALLCDNK
ncbi:dynein axonemal heavy chain 8 [Cotesia glomerata]|nr:dynein axonemal heavy chain 8 [Cotesia glomerata]